MIVFYEKKKFDENKEINHSSEKNISSEKYLNDTTLNKYLESIGLCNQLSSPLTVFDNRKKKFIYCNNKFIKLAGLSEYDCYNLTFDDFEKWIHPDDHFTLHHQIGIRLRTLYNENLDAFNLNTIQFSFNFNFRLKEKDSNGKHLSILAQSSVIEWDESNIPGILLILLSDISNYSDNNKIIFTIDLYDANDQQWVNVFREEFKNKPSILTRREYEIFTHIINDKSASEIAGLLNIAFHTVRTHWRNIFSKTGCKSQRELKLLAQKQGWG